MRPWLQYCSCRRGRIAAWYADWCLARCRCYPALALACVVAGELAFIVERRSPLFPPAPHFAFLHQPGDGDAQKDAGSADECCLRFLAPDSSLCAAVLPLKTDNLNRQH